MQYASKDGLTQPDQNALTASKGPSGVDLPRIQAVAEGAALEAGQLQMRHFGKKASITDRFDHDLKIETDRASEAIIFQNIIAQFPHHAILSEESGSSGASDYTWIIDPLDGTVNYYFGLPFFCTCVACYHTPNLNHQRSQKLDASKLMEGKPLVGVVYAPYFDWMFSAASGQGATINGKIFHTPGASDLKDSIVGISYGSKDTIIRQMESVANELLRKAKKVRMLGATGLDLSQVARGNLSGLVQLNVNIWDFAAARLILTESGAAFQARLNALNGWQILAAPQPVFGQLMEIVNGALADGFLQSNP